MPAAATLTEDRPAFVGLSEAARRFGKSPTWVLRATVRGEIRTKIEPGRPPRYSTECIDRILAEGGR